MKKQTQELIKAMTQELELVKSAAASSTNDSSDETAAEMLSMSNELTQKYADEIKKIEEEIETIDSEIIASYNYYWDETANISVELAKEEEMLEINKSYTNLIKKRNQEVGSVKLPTVREFNGTKEAMEFMIEYLSSLDACLEGYKLSRKRMSEILNDIQSVEGRFDEIITELEFDGIEPGDN